MLAFHQLQTMQVSPWISRLTPERPAITPISTVLASYAMERRIDAPATESVTVRPALIFRKRRRFKIITFLQLNAPFEIRLVFFDLPPSSVPSYNEGLRMLTMPTLENYTCDVDAARAT